MLERVCVAEVVVRMGVGVCTCGSVCVCKGAHSPVTQMREA